MFTKEDKMKKNWRSIKRALKKARNKRDRLLKRLEKGKYDKESLPELRTQITEAKVQVSVLELRVGDKPE